MHSLCRLLNIAIILKAPCYVFVVISIESSWSAFRPNAYLNRHVYLVSDVVVKCMFHITHGLMVLKLK